jgi:hypothetical protein
MSLCANISSKTTNKVVNTNPSDTDIHHIESERAIIRDKRNSFNYNLKKCRTITEQEYRQLGVSKKKQFSNTSNERREQGLDGIYNSQLVKESDIILEEGVGSQLKPR